MAIVTVKTANMRTAAVLLATGLEFHASRCLPDSGLVEIDFLCDEKQQPEALKLVEACQRNYNVTVHLGKYEQAFKRIRAIIKSTKESE